MSSSHERVPESRKLSLPNDRASVALPSLKLKTVTATPPLAPSNNSLLPSDVRLWPCWMQETNEVAKPTKMRLSDALKPPTMSSSTREPFSEQSKKPRDVTPAATPEPADPAWHVSYHRDLAKRIVKYGLNDPDFNPTIAEMLTDLETDPKAAGEKKSGKLKDARAYVIRHRDVEWRAVYTIDEKAHIVRIVRSILTMWLTETR